MNHILFDSDKRNQLLPFTHTRPVADIRCGILTMRERWEHYLHAATGSLTLPYLQAVFPHTAGNDNLYINGAVFADEALSKAIKGLAPETSLIQGDTTIAIRTAQTLVYGQTENFTAIRYTGDLHLLNNPWDIFSLNDYALRADYALLTKGRRSAMLPAGITVTGNALFMEEGAKINAGCIINTETGPVYIGKDAEILEGTMIRGPLALGDHGVIKMGAKIYGATTIGPGCKVGGEISNVVFFANSNKGHDGYLGNAVIGEWCNLGADTNCSNLKNNYDEVKVWSEEKNALVKTGLTFCGLLMGDHSKCGINTMFNTGTVAGVSCNIYGGGFPDKFIPSFAWGGAESITTYSFEKAMETAARMMKRRNKEMTAAEADMYRHIFDNTAAQRTQFS